MISTCDDVMDFLICSFQGEDPYPWPMFSSHPLPHCYTLDPSKIHQDSQGTVRGTSAMLSILTGAIHIVTHDFSSCCTDSEISAFLASSKDSKNEESWMEMCRRRYCKVMTSKPNSLTGKGKSQLPTEGSCRFDLMFYLQ